LGFTEVEDGILLQSVLTANEDNVIHICSLQLIAMAYQLSNLVDLNKLRFR